MMLLYAILTIALLVPTLAVAGVLLGARNEHDKGKASHTARLRQQWANVGVQWPKDVDPALPPPSRDDVSDLASFEFYQREHVIEMAVQRVADRASDMYENCGYTIDGAKSEAMRKLGAGITEAHGWDITKEVRARFDTLPVYLLLKDSAMSKLERESDQLLAEYREGGLSAASQLATDNKIGQDRTFAPFAWMDRDRKALAQTLRASGENRTDYRKRRIAAKADNPHGAAALQPFEGDRLGRPS